MKHNKKKTIKYVFIACAATALVIIFMFPKGDAVTYNSVLEQATTTAPVQSDVEKAIARIQEEMSELEREIKEQEAAKQEAIKRHDEEKARLEGRKEAIRTQLLSF